MSDSSRGGWSIRDERDPRIPVYDGRSSNFTVYRNTQGRHFWWHEGDSAHRYAAYGSNSC